MYDLSGALINSISVANPLNMFTQGVGIVTNGLPGAYNAMKEQQVGDLTKELGITPPSAGIIAHIPPSETGIPDTRQIPIVKEVVNGFHGVEVYKKTFFTV